jgi:hypothetical protein
MEMDGTDIKSCETNYISSLDLIVNILWKRTRELLNREKFVSGISVFRVFQMILYSLVSGELF